MKIVGFKINNYKSIGSNENYLLVEPNVTALIGKNESGKSNILEAIGKLSFLSPMNVNYMNNKNRGISGEISIISDLEFYQSELDEFGISQSKTSIHFVDSSSIRFEGGLSELIKNDGLLMNTVDELVEYQNNRNVWGNDSTRLNTVRGYLNELKDIPTQIFVNANAKLDNLNKLIINEYENKEYLINSIVTIQEHLEKYYSLLPQIYYRDKDHQLESIYKYDDIKNILKDTNHIFYRFLLAAEIDVEEIVKAFETAIDGDKQTIRNRIINKIKINIEDKFNGFYTQERIKFQIVFEGNLFKIYVLTDDKAMNLSERSNGLRWYLSLFVDVLSRDLKGRSVLYLLDEPGVYLHVNAQKELLKLFSKLTEKENQIIYTTHSPYMIDSRDILNVRAIEKDENGNTKIFKNAYNQKLSSRSKMETLSPLLKAIGADLKFNIGPSSINNIITEGISDYMYVQAMIKYLKIDRPPNIIPSAGASNISRVASILMGWGCDFKVLLDYDKAGYDEYEVLINKLDETLKSKVFFVNCVLEPDDKEMKLFPKSIESLICEDDFKKLNTPYDGTNDTKVLAAKEFYDKVNTQEIVPEKATILKFKRLLNQLGV